jgi:hypothetical protein
MSDKFIGFDAALRELVIATGIKGEWRALGDKIQFRAHDGAILNWWPKTKTINFQGSGSPASELKEKLRHLAGEFWIGGEK